MVDDEPLVLKYTTSVITGLGYKKVLKAQNAEEARAAIAVEKLTLIICDVSLPDGDGRQIMCEALEAHPDIACVLFTGFSTGDLSLPAELRDRVMLLEKPFTADDISHVLAELIDRRAARVVSNQT